MKKVLTFVGWIILAIIIFAAGAATSVICPSLGKKIQDAAIKAGALKNEKEPQAEAPTE